MNSKCETQKTYTYKYLNAIALVANRKKITYQISRFSSHHNLQIYIGNLLKQKKKKINDSKIIMRIVEMKISIHSKQWNSNAFKRLHNSCKYTFFFFACFCRLFFSIEFNRQTTTQLAHFRFFFLLFFLFVWIRRTMNDDAYKYYFTKSNYKCLYFFDATPIFVCLSRFNSIKIWLWCWWNFHSQI